MDGEERRELRGEGLGEGEGEGVGEGGDVRAGNVPFVHGTLPLPPLPRPPPLQTARHVEAKGLKPRCAAALRQSAPDLDRCSAPRDGPLKE